MDAPTSLMWIISHSTTILENNLHLLCSCIYWRDHAWHARSQSEPRLQACLRAKLSQNSLPFSKFLIQSSRSLVSDSFLCSLKLQSLQCKLVISKWQGKRMEYISGVGWGWGANVNMMSGEPHQLRDKYQGQVYNKYRTSKIRINKRQVQYKS